MRLILLLFAVFYVATSTLSQFHFHFKLTCNIPSLYHYSIEFWDSDTVTPDDRITSRVDGTALGVSEKIMKGEQDEEEVFSDGYNVYASIWHNCTSHSLLVPMRLNISPFCEIGMNCNVYFELDLTNKQGDYLINAKVESL